MYIAWVLINKVFGFLPPCQKCIGIWWRDPLLTIHTPKKVLWRNNRYYVFVDSHSNIAVIKLRYHANLYLNGEPWLHKRALPLVPCYSCTNCNQSVIYILKLCVTIYWRIIWQLLWQLQILVTFLIKQVDSFLKNNCCNVVKENRLCFVVNRDIPSINQPLSNRKYTILD